MKKLKVFIAVLSTAFLVETAVVPAQAFRLTENVKQEQKQENKKKKGWSRKGKGAAIGAGAGAATGAVVGGGKGALIGAGAGAVGGAIIGKKQDKKKDPQRHEQYSDKNKKE